MAGDDAAAVNGRARRVKPYRVETTGLGVHEVLDAVNRLVYVAHGPNWKARNDFVGVFADPLFQYERLMRELAAVPGLSCIPFRELLARVPQPGEIFCGIRHDVDVDARTALDLARLERDYGMRTTYFILHTAPYYGHFKDRVFCRNDSMIHVYREIQDLGHEIALHTDALHVYQEQGMDGAEALVEEIGWLRSHGIDLVGTTAHNSASVYGAENFAVFAGRPRSFSDSNPCAEVFQGKKWAPLGVLSERALGLRYEANDLFWQANAEVTYAATRGVNLWRWSSDGRKGFVRQAGAAVEHGFLSFEALMDRVAEMDKGRYLCLVVHPVYYGARHAEGSGPVLEMTRRSVCVNPALGWETYEPLSLQATSGRAGGVQEFQALNFTNAAGMLDLPKIGNAEDAARILLLGGTNVDGASCGLPAHLHTLLEARLKERWKKPVHVHKAAHPGMGLARSVGWYRALREDVRPALVVLGIGADELATSLPEYWSRQTGYHADYPPGEYLRVGAEVVTVVACSPLHALHRRQGDPAASAPSLAAEPQSAEEQRSVAEGRRCVERLIDEFVAAIRGDGVDVLLLVQECGESAGLWSSATAQREWRTGHDHFQAWLQPLAARLNVVVIDPYEKFLGAGGRQPTHWRANGHWNYVGHELAADAAVETIGGAWPDGLSMRPGVLDG